MRGLTLIELMICVAIIGILSALSGLSTGHLRMNARAEIQQEQALLLLQHHADHLSKGTEPRAETLARLQAPLPRSSVTFEGGSVTTITVVWSDPFGRPSRRSLSAFARGGPR